MRANGIKELIRLAWDLTSPNKLPINLGSIEERVSVALEQFGRTFQNVVSVDINKTILIIQTKPLGNQSQRHEIKIDFVSERQAEEARSYVAVKVEEAPKSIGSFAPQPPKGPEFVVDL